VNHTPGFSEQQQQKTLGVVLSGTVSNHSNELVKIFTCKHYANTLIYQQQNNIVVHKALCCLCEKEYLVLPILVA
jgi:hypothetical protein